MPFDAAALAPETAVASQVGMAGLVPTSPAYRLRATKRPNVARRLREEVSFRFHCWAFQRECPLTPDHASVQFALKVGRALIADPDHWGQNRFHQIDAYRRHERHCAMGAMRRAGRTYRINGAVYTLACDQLHHQARLLGFNGIESLNDCTNHATVMAVFDKAIARLA